MEYLILFASGLLAGGINSIAGGGIFVILPALLISGLTGKQANASGSFAVWAGQATSLFENRHMLPNDKKLLKMIAIVATAGSTTGALLLILTPNVSFERALPWLNLVATILFVSGPWLKKYFKKPSKTPKYTLPIFLLMLSVYGGYFGGGLGMLILAILGFSSTQDVRYQNTVKLILTSLINAVSIGIVIFAQLIVWRYALPAAAGAITGGFIGSRLSRYIPVSAVRYMVAAIGILTTIYIFIKFS